MPRDVFVCYAHEDEEIAQQVVASLESAGISCWIESRDALLGEKWAEMIVRGMDESKIVVFILSAHSNDSDACKRRLALARDKRKQIIPIHVEDVQLSNALQYYLAGMQRIDARMQAVEDYRSKLVGTARWLANRATEGSVTTAETENEQKDASQASKMVETKPEPRDGLEEAKVTKQKEDTSPHEIFISFKNFDARGNETRDCEIARTIANFLRNEGLNVFFSIDSLEKSGSSAYKKAIDDALDRATILIAVGTSREHLLSDWVRYEWDGFLQDIIEGVKPEGRIFTVIEGFELKALPRGLRQRQVFFFSDKELTRMINYIRNAL